ncbi:hypothetical protein KM481_gp41 [Harp seal herpesvirus]|uniref:Uncharacterized protein n=1 Tax=phocid gammaherpesvirus 3 TaxID=2560643 RepID=A0A0R5ZE41_9GAMA|nr:hypothetical protein KM481_gp41 [Harp seal herpesvirus]AJG42971.1 hypothetical protein [Harp seal herpesvirus]
MSYITKAVYIFLFMRNVASLQYLAIPCCNILLTDVSELYSIFEVNTIVLNVPKTCGNVNVAQIVTKPKNSNTIVPICVNGFNLMSFLLNLLQRISYNHPNAVNSTLISDLEKYKTQFSKNFTTETAKTNFKFMTYSSSTKKPRRSRERNKTSTAKPYRKKLKTPSQTNITPQKL